MGISCIFKILGSQFNIIDEYDFDKIFDSTFHDIAYSLPRTHSFRRLFEALEYGSCEKSIYDKMEGVLGEEGEDGYSITSWEELKDFEEYANGDVAQLWDDLFPGKKPGLRNWYNYHTNLKAIENTYKSQVYYQEDLSDLLRIVKRAIEEKGYLVRLIY